MTVNIYPLVAFMGVLVMVLSFYDVTNYDWILFCAGFLMLSEIEIEVGNLKLII